ncbi:hypothetical protein [Bacillus sp. COPE52]|uniref:hypothetical protein n=1 Tax=Bacillus sp. COPE52 TaxID=2233998 RepID=UPI000E10840B|nr:hypothetical protein [Bacillus sp. COPE52]AXK19139.1 hypothetical protein DPQ31_16140 [Bacillus sp. COPE52]
MRQIKIELEKDFHHCPKREMDEFKELEREYINEQKKGKQRHEWTKRKPAYTNCEECDCELWVWDDYGQKHGVCGETCYLSLVGMSWSDFF